MPTSGKRLQNAWTGCQSRLQDLEQQLSNAVLLEPSECRDEVQRIVANLRTSSPKPPSQTQGTNIAVTQGHQTNQNASFSDEVHANDPVGEEVSSPRQPPVQRSQAKEYIATSKFYDQESPSVDTQTIADPTDQIKYHKRWLASNARFQEAHEQLAYAKLEKDQRVDPSTARKLLEIYWTWQAPLHNCVYRRSFFRDMAMNGPYFSDFLLFVIYSHAARHVSPTDPVYSALQDGEVLLDRARLLLLDELKREKPLISTIQGLLILGGRQCAIGRNSEGWLYTGMAISMIKDRGFHLSRRFSMESTEPDDYETQKRLYLSAFVWDKSISLCLGRPTSLTSMPYPDHCLYDTSDDVNIWQPVHLGNLATHYLPTPCYNSSTFSYLNDAFRSVFGPKVRTATVENLRAIEQALYDFHETLPEALRLDDAATCPPPHICCLNILYHTILILIYRPFLINRGAYIHKESALFERAAMVCTREAATVNTFFQAYGRCFANRNQTYLLSYCVYTAATIDVHLVGDPDDSVSAAAKARLVTSLQMLDGEAKQTPGVRRSIDIIRSRLGQLNNESRQALICQGNDMASSGHPQSLDAITESEVTASHGVVLPQFQNVWTPDIHQHAIGGTSSLYQHWPVDVTQMFSTWGADTINVGGGFVPDTPGWHSSFQR